MGLKCLLNKWNNKMKIFPKQVTETTNKYLKQCSASLRNEQMLARKRNPFLFTAGKSANWLNHYQNQYGVLKQLRVELPYDSDTPYLTLRKTLVLKYVHTHVLSILLTFAKKWSQPRC